MPARSRIEDFARNVLGCDCPDEVFKVIECQQGDAPRETPYSFRIAIGGRLLVYILETDDLEVVRKGLPEMLSAGKAERDEKGMNRFRAVVSTDDTETLEDAAKGIFEDFAEKDEKIHLHVLKKGDVAGVHAECG